MGPPERLMPIRSIPGLNYPVQVGGGEKVPVGGLEGAPGETDPRPLVAGARFVDRGAPSPRRKPNPPRPTRCCARAHRRNRMSSLRTESTREYSVAVDQEARAPQAKTRLPRIGRRQLRPTPSLRPVVRAAGVARKSWASTTWLGGDHCAAVTWALALAGRPASAPDPISRASPRRGHAARGQELEERAMAALCARQPSLATLSRRAQSLRLRFLQSRVASASYAAPT